MHAFRLHLILSAALGVVLVMPPGGGAAHAGTDTAQLTVTAQVQSGCTVDGGTLDFGTYTAGQPDDLDATGLITISNCANVSVTIELDGGSSGNIQDRTMVSGSNVLHYQLYRFSDYTQIWGTGQQAMTFMPISNSSPVFIYGKIPGGQNVPPGTYTDTVNITITF